MVIGYVDFSRQQSCRIEIIHPEEGNLPGPGIHGTSHVSGQDVGGTGTVATKSVGGVVLRRNVPFVARFPLDWHTVPHHA